MKNEIRQTCSSFLAETDLTIVYAPPLFYINHRKIRCYVIFTIFVKSCKSAKVSQNTLLPRVDVFFSVCAEGLFAIKHVHFEEKKLKSVSYFAYFMRLRVILLQLFFKKVEKHVSSSKNRCFWYNLPL